MPNMISYLDSPMSDLRRLHQRRLEWLEQTPGPIVALPSEYPDGYTVPDHHHGRSQLLHALMGVVLVKTRHGRWMVPPDHAMWIPAGVEHAVDMLGDVSMRSVYVAPDAIEGLPARLRVVGVSDLMRSLIVEAVALPDEEALAIALYACLRGNGLDECLRVAVTHGGDSDSTGAIAGNMLGVMIPAAVLSHPWATVIQGADIIGRLARDHARLLRLPDAADALFEFYPAG